MELKTLSRKDPEFESYLRGTFSSTLRAIPVQSLNVSTESEEVTFKIIPVSEIKEPAPLKKWVEVFKLRSFVLLGFPLFLILVKNSYFDDIEMDPVLVITTVLGCFSLLIGGNLLNDYFDHVRGLDRIHPDQQKKPIQEGWVTAESTRKWSALYLIFGVLMGVPAVFVTPELLLFAMVPGAVALWSWLSASRRGARYRRGTEFLVFLMAGPLLTCGFQMAVTGAFELESLWLGVLSGLFCSFFMHLKNFRFLVVNSQAGFQNTISRLGFERSKVFLLFWWLLFILNFFLYHYVYWGTHPLWVAGSAVVPLVIARPLFTLLYRLSSPAGSEMRKTVEVGRKVAFMTLTWWLIENLWLIWELGFGDQA